MSKFSRLCLGVWWTLATAGCGRVATGIDYNSTTLNLDSLVTVVNARALSLQSIKGSADLVVRSPDLGRPRTVQVSLIAERPDRARLRGRAGALVSIFDLVTDRDSLKLYLPHDHALVVESVAQGSDVALLASRELIPALLQETLSRELVPADSGFGRTGGGYLVVQVERDRFGGTITRRLFYDKDRLRLVHQSIERRDAGGRVRTALVQYLDHRWTGRQWFPMIVKLELPDTKQGLQLRFVSYTANAPIDPQLFVLEVPPNTRRVSAEDLNNDFMGEAPEVVEPR